MVAAHLRRRGFDRSKSQQKHGSAWHDWTPDNRGFNHEAFKGLSPEDYGRLNALGLGPSGITVPGHNDPHSGGHGYWADGPNQDIDPFSNTPYGDRHRYENSERNADNRGIWENAVQATGKFNINNAEELMGFVSEIENYKAGNADFMKEGKLTQKDVWDLTENWNKAEPVAQQAAPVVADPVEVAETPAVVEETPVVREPVKGVDYMSSDMQDAYDRIQIYNSGFSADKWIADTTKPDEQSQAHAQALADKYKFEIKEDLKPTEDSVLNALNAAIPAIGGLMT